MDSQEDDEDYLEDGGDDAAGQQHLGPGGGHADVPQGLGDVRRAHQQVGDGDEEADDAVAQRVNA